MKRQGVQAAMQVSFMTQSLVTVRGVCEGPWCAENSWALRTPTRGDSETETGGLAKLQVFRARTKDGT